MRKFRFICLLVIAVAVSCFAQETNSIQVRIIDRVRLRESIGVDAKILATLESGDEGTYIDKQETEKDPAHSVFAWIKILINGKAGWVYGAYVSVVDPQMGVKSYRVSNVNEISLRINGKDLYVGMAQDEAMQILGKPDSEADDQEAHVLTCAYKDNGVVIEYDVYHKCVKSITIRTSTVALASRIQVGVSIDDVIKPTTSYAYDSANTVFISSVYAPTYNTWYAPAISFVYDEKRRISEIFISLNME